MLRGAGRGLTRPQQTMALSRAARTGGPPSAKRNAVDELAGPGRQSPCRDAEYHEAGDISWTGAERTFQHRREIALLRSKICDLFAALAWDFVEDDHQGTEMGRGPWEMFHLAGVRAPWRSAEQAVLRTKFVT